MIGNKELETIRQILQAELDRLQGNGPGGRSQRAGSNLDRDDLAHNFSARERHSALRDVEVAKMAQIKKALAGIDEGTYGLCATCGEAIAPGRLEIMPYAVFCVGCQKSQESS
jgi:DnaK suppressor protein